MTTVAVCARSGEDGVVVNTGMTFSALLEDCVCCVKISVVVGETELAVWVSGGTSLGMSGSTV